MKYEFNYCPETGIDMKERGCAVGNLAACREMIKHSGCPPVER